ncbi:DUF1269 domain-containing protein [Scytonema sp. UIC 10036]|nr:DUF1269 domain-containing protein [Scytonema sp. UIC 10036]
MALVEHKRAAGVFSNRSEAESALTTLRDANFPMNKISVIARDCQRDIAGIETQPSIGHQVDEEAAVGAVTGTILGGITGLIVGLGTLAFPGVSPVLLAGEIISTVGATAAGAGIGAATGGLLGVLLGLGMPEERARVYSDRVLKGNYLIIVYGTDEEILHADYILNDRGIEEFGIYNSPGVAEAQVAKSDSVVKRDVVTILDRRNTSNVLP